MSEKKIDPCPGMNCGCTDGVSHSPECRAETAATYAGGWFVKASAAPQPDAWCLRNKLGHVIAWYANRDAALSEQAKYWPASTLHALYDVSMSQAATLAEQAIAQLQRERAISPAALNRPLDAALRTAPQPAPATGTTLSDDERAAIEFFTLNPSAAVMALRSRIEPATGDEREALSEFDALIDAYQCAQKDGTFDQRVEARAALKNAFKQASAAHRREDQRAWAFVERVAAPGHKNGALLRDDARELLATRDAAMQRTAAPAQTDTEDPQ